MREMNGSETKIEIFGPFGEAFEWMKRMLFKPFDFQKWLVVGFAAFLSNLSGNANFNFSRKMGRGSDWSFRSMSHDFSESTGTSEWLTSCAIPLIILLVLVALAVAVTLLWVGCRGRFIFADCIVHNRGAIAAPWREYRPEANSFFIFSLLVGLAVLAIIAIAFVPIVLPFIQGWTEGAAFAASLTIGIVLVVGLVLLIAAAWSLVSQLMVPVMYRRRCRALAAFKEVLGLIAARPGPMMLYLLFFIVLGLGAAMIACVSMPLTCCITMIPYVGTVALLPVYVVLAAFPLFFLRQFGPDYDVWAMLAQQELAAPEITQSPQMNPPSTPPA